MSSEDIVPFFMRDFLISFRCQITSSSRPTLSKMFGTHMIMICAFNSADWCSFQQISWISQLISSQASLILALPRRGMIAHKYGEGLNSSSSICQWGEGLEGASCWERPQENCLFFTPQYLKARMAEDGNPSSTQLLVRAGWEEVSSSRCNSNPLIVLGNISIRAKSPRSRVVLLSFSPSYFRLTCRNQKCPLLPSIAVRHSEIIVFFLVVIADLILWKETVWYWGIVEIIQYQLTHVADSWIGHWQNARQRVSSWQRWCYIRWRSVGNQTTYVPTDGSKIREEVGSRHAPTLNGGGTNGSFWVGNRCGRVTYFWSFVLQWLIINNALPFFESKSKSSCIRGNLLLILELLGKFGSLGS